MQNHIVWVFGSSAAGKETFIRNFSNNPSQDLINFLGWDGKIIPIEESLEYIRQFENDPVAEKRKQIIEKVKDADNQSNAIILIKGQDGDFEFDLLNKLKKEIPDAFHEIIFLHADLEILFNRSRKKSWWSEEDEREGINGFRKWLVDYQLEPLRKLKGFKVIALDSSDYNYKPISFPPKI